MPELRTIHARSFVETTFGKQRTLAATMYLPRNLGSSMGSRIAPLSVLFIRSARETDARTGEPTPLPASVSYNRFLLTAI